jgi:hypothetical protein
MRVRSGRHLARQGFLVGHLLHQQLVAVRRIAGLRPDGNAADFKIVTGMHPTGFTHSFEATIQSGNRSVVDGEDGGHEGGERLSLQVSGGGNTAHPVGNASVIGNPAVDTKWLRGPNLVTGHWYHFVFYVRWDWRANSNSGHGLVEYFIDGKNIGTYHGPTLF